MGICYELRSVQTEALRSEGAAISASPANTSSDNIQDYLQLGACWRCLQQALDVDGVNAGPAARLVRTPPHHPGQPWVAVSGTLTAAEVKEIAQHLTEILDARGSARSEDWCSSAYANTLNCEALARCLRFTIGLREAGLGLEWRIG
ncbi:hypothetical protein GCM10022200_14190 [Microbacterium awajiense]|uniref:Uncharacterized protein n=1 Tax=Microbacterium awajiense TaxID=415214 RepID=A0ABP7AH84_9MICO